MTGPEHYRAAEQLLGEAATMDSSFVGTATKVQRAQVHVTLALTAAAAFPAVRYWLGDEARDGRAWSELTS